MGQIHMQIRMRGVKGVKKQREAKAVAEAGRLKGKTAEKRSLGSTVFPYTDSAVSLTVQF